MRTLLKSLGRTISGRIAMAGFFCGLLGFASPAFSQISLDLHLGSPQVVQAPAPVEVVQAPVEVAPVVMEEAPPARVEVIPVRPYEGAVWASGRYIVEPRTHRYVWTAGSWDRPGMERAEIIRHDESPDRQFDRGGYYERAPGRDVAIQNREAMQSRSNTVQYRTGTVGSNTAQYRTGTVGNTAQYRTGTVGNTAQYRAGTVGNTAQYRTGTVGNTAQYRTGAAGNTTQSRNQ